MVEYEYYPIEKEQIKTPISLMIEHDVTNLITASISATRNGSWEFINETLIPHLKDNENGNLLAKEFLKSENIGSKNPIRRGVSAMGLKAVTITDMGILEESFEKMTKMSKDKKIFPAEKAIEFLEVYEEKKANIPVKIKGLRANLKKILKSRSQKF